MKFEIPPHFQPVSITELNRAWTKVWRELVNHGFACRRLERCQVYPGTIHTAYGYQWFGDRSDGRVCGDIILPRISFSQWRLFLQGQKKESVVDILRHEYGHAYADVNRRRIETKRFEQAFGWPNPLYPRASGGAGAEGMKKQFLINSIINN